jgi:hypothetical protein
VHEAGEKIRREKKKGEGGEKINKDMKRYMRWIGMKREEERHYFTRCLDAVDCKCVEQLVPSTDDMVCVCVYI